MKNQMPAFSSIVLLFFMLWAPLGQYEFLIEHWMKIGTYAVPFILFMFFSSRTKQTDSGFSDIKLIAVLLLVAYIIHQFEEHWIDLYGREFAFQSALNQLVGSAFNVQTENGDVPEILTRASVFVINTSLVWLVGALAIWRGNTDIFPVLAMIAIAFVNAISHIASALATGGYNPGLLTSVAVFLPLSFWAYWVLWRDGMARSEEHTSELQSRPHISYAVFCLKKKKKEKKKRKKKQKQ